MKPLKPPTVPSVLFQYHETFPDGRSKTITFGALPWMLTAAVALSKLPYVQALIDLVKHAGVAK